MKKAILLFMVVAAMSLVPVAPVLADTVITSCADITAPGSYVFTSNVVCTDGSLNPIPSLPSASAGILISASNVTLDLAGWDLIGPGGVTAVSTYGIYAENSFSNITIENGTVSGFLTGIELTGGTSDLVTNVTIVNAPANVPEPSSLMLLGIGMFAMVGFRLKRQPS